MNWNFEFVHYRRQFILSNKNKYENKIKKIPIHEKYKLSYFTLSSLIHWIQFISNLLTHCIISNLNSKDKKHTLERYEKKVEHKNISWYFLSIMPLFGFLNMYTVIDCRVNKICVKISFSISSEDADDRHQHQSVYLWFGRLYVFV